MPLAPGTKLGPYEILAPLGAGGMGEVYRAHDSRLGRDVAVKVLPGHLSATPEVRARFEREARTVSGLNHPNICALYDVGSQDGADYLVLELVEGETLAARLARGPLPAPEVTRLGVQIADALDRAHRSGVVHRDLKPANIMLTRGGVKLLDFGLARVTGLAPSVSDITSSPTVAAPLTAEGSIVGTFQYMAPEQLEGKEADERSDIWALGAVLYEMATGKRAFEGRSQASLIAAILEKEPAPISELAPLSPPGLDRLVRACLAKDPDQRLQTAHDARLQLQWVAEGGSQAGVPAPVAARRRGRERLAWATAGALGLVVVALGATAALRRSDPPQVVRFDVRPPKTTTSMFWPRLSPDGTMLAFVATDSNGTRRLWVRPVDAVEAHPVTGLEGNARPFWSPDSRFLAYIAEGKLRKVSVAGGPAISICDAPGGSDGTWGRRDWILFDGGGTDSIRGVPASGGVPRPITRIDHAHGDIQNAWPFFLPDGRHFLFIANGRGSVGAIRLGTLGSFESRVVGHTDSRVEYAPSGDMVYVSGGTLVAQRLDVGGGRSLGDPVPVGEDVSLGGESGDFSVSAAGVLAYRTQGSQEQSRLIWVARDGRPLGDAAPPGAYEDVALSPDGARVALSIATEQPPTLDIWVRDLARGVSSRLTFDPSDEILPVWSPDGTRIVYASNRAGEFRPYLKAANGVGSEDSLPHLAGGHEAPTDWSAAANTIVTSRLGPQGWDVWVQPTDRRQAPKPFLQSPFFERWGRLSPDGRWLAYMSNESGRAEIYVVPFPGPGGKWQVSTAGGTLPMWRADGKELFFQAADRSIMAVDVRAGDTFEVGVPKALFRLPLTEGTYQGYRWAPTRDGQRFLVNTPAGSVAESRFIVVTNWTADLAHR